MPNETIASNVPAVPTSGTQKFGFATLFMGVLVMDQATKWFAEKAYLTFSNASKLEDYQASAKHVGSLGHSPFYLELGQSPSTNWIDFNLTYLRNEGAVWGIFSNLPDMFRLGLFYCVTAVAVFVVLRMFKQSPSTKVLFRTALVMILAGAIGNFCDRLALKYVIDWLHFHWKIFGWEYSFPVFNVADIAIDVGIGLMLLDAWFDSRLQKKTDALNTKTAATNQATTVTT